MVPNSPTTIILKVVGKRKKFHVVKLKSHPQRQPDRGLSFQDTLEGRLAATVSLVTSPIVEWRGRRRHRGGGGGGGAGSQIRPGPPC